MRQVLFHIPIYIFPNLPDGLPIYGYGFMLFLAFVACIFLSSWLARKEGIPKEMLQDLAIWIFVCGILGARIVYMIQYRDRVAFTDIYKIWDGGLVFYGSALGGVVGYFLAYYFVFHKQHISTWKIADIIAPCVAIGLCLGRLGCFLNGCCYGNVACTDRECSIFHFPPAVTFPLTSQAMSDSLNQGFQTLGGFTLTAGDDQARVDEVEPKSPADEAGLKQRDVIVEVNGQTIERYYDPDDRDNPKTLWGYLFRNWPRGETQLELKVMREVNGKTQVVALEPFVPRTLGLHPTQLYESISMGLVFLLLLAYYPFRRHDGELFVLLMLCYSVHRFLNEILRKDTDPVFAGLTLSQNGSILVFAAALVLGWWLWRKPVQYTAGQPVADYLTKDRSTISRSAGTPA
jgi:prolipoprotein diacylglyceryltransferase